MCGFLSLSSLLTTSVVTVLEPLGPGTGGEQDLFLSLSAILAGADQSRLLRFLAGIYYFHDIWSPSLSD